MACTLFGRAASPVGMSRIALQRVSNRLSLVSARRLTVATAAPEAATLKLIGISGSLRKASFNTGLLRVAGASLPPGVDFEGVPLEVAEFCAKVAAADAVLFASPEYNSSFTAVLKNALDWASRPPKNLWAGKVGAIVSGGGSVGGSRAQPALRQVCVDLDITMLSKPECFVQVYAPGVTDAATGDVVSEDAKKRVKAVVNALVELARKLNR